MLSNQSSVSGIRTRQGGTLPDAAFRPLCPSQSLHIAISSFQMFSVLKYALQFTALFALGASFLSSRRRLPVTSSGWAGICLTIR